MQNTLYKWKWKLQWDPNVCCIQNQSLIPSSLVTIQGVLCTENHLVSSSVWEKHNLGHIAWRMNSTFTMHCRILWVQNLTERYYPPFPQIKIIQSIDLWRTEGRGRAIAATLKISWRLIRLTMLVYCRRTIIFTSVWLVCSHVYSTWCLPAILPTPVPMN